jgi:hypothetical protein
MEGTSERATEDPEPSTDPMEALRWHWGEAYEISTDADGWHARRRDGLSEPMTAESPEVLRTLIVQDYTGQPVSRPQR